MSYAQAFLLLIIKKGTMRKGDIYSYYNDGKKKYTALQVVDVIAEKNQCVLLGLYYWDDEPLTAIQLDKIKPFWQNHHSWKGEYSFVLCEGEMPKSYTFVGSKEVLAYPENELNHVSSWYYSCLQVSLQKAWDELPESYRTSYKSVEVSRSSIRADEVAEMADGTELSKYPHLTKLEVDGENSWMMDYVNTHHNITELLWENYSENTINLSNSRIVDFKTDGKGAKLLVLNDYLHYLYFIDSIPSDLEVQTALKNRSFDLHLRNTNNLQVFKSANVTELQIVGNGKEPIDMAEIAKYLPSLRTLRIWGNPDSIENMGAIAKFVNLRWLTLNDTFGFTASDFPSPNKLPAVSCIWMNSIPEDVAKKVKKEYKHIELWIRKARKPEWLKANLNNPFRHWDGDEYISAAHAKKATAIYAKQYKQICDFIKVNTSTDVLQKELEEIVKAYAEEFNKMDKRTHWIDTVTREDIWEALNLMLKPAIEVHGGKINVDGLMDLFDRIRDF